jgi:hypothetical protein
MIFRDGDTSSVSKSLNLARSRSDNELNHLEFSYPSSEKGLLISPDLDLEARSNGYCDMKCRTYVHIPFRLKKWSKIAM